MANYSLNNSAVALAFFEGVELLGIQSSLEPHKFAWTINKALGFDFRYQPESEIHVYKNNRHLYFPIFKYDEMQIQVCNLLYTNVNDGAYLLPELRHTDFLWMIRWESEGQELGNLIAAELKKLDHIQLVQKIDTLKIKNKENLVL